MTDRPQEAGAAAGAAVVPALPASAPPEPAPAFSLSVAAAWRAYRADPHWVRKTVLGGLAYLIPVVGSFAVMSWQVGYIRRVAWGDDRPLPEVGDLETLAKRALYLFAGTFVWALPLYAVIFACIAMMGATLGLVIVAGISGRAPVLVAGILLVSFLFTALIAAASLGYGVVLEAAIARFALYDRLDAFWEVREILGTLKGNWKPLLFAMVRIWLISVAIVGCIELVFLTATVGLGIGMFALFLPVAAIRDEALQQTASLGALGGVFLVQAAVWLFQIVLMVSMFVAIFPIVTMSSHVYGQWARRVYRLDVPAAR